MVTMLIIARFVVASDQGNLLLRKSLIIPLPIPKMNEYIKDIRMVNKKLSRFFSFVKNKKKNRDVANDTQNRVITFLRFMIEFLKSKLALIKSNKNYFFLSCHFYSLNCTKKPSVIGKVLFFNDIILLVGLRNIPLQLFPSLDLMTF